MLDVSNLTSGYGDAAVLHNVSFSVDNEIFAVLGANGAGKTTLLKTLAKLLPVQSGSIAWNGEDITATPGYDLPAKGVAYVPQEHNVFPDLSVAENLSLGALVGTRDKDVRLDDVYTLFPRLADRKTQLAGSLSGGEGQMLAVSRALMQDPRIILLDEPSAGLSPLLVETLFDAITAIRSEKGVAIVLAEQNAVKTLEIADRMLVLNLGQVHLIKPAGELDRKQLMEAYHI
ncbi:MAG: ABC transporter ATP-binding protein [Stappiaceae bacterium]